MEIMSAVPRERRVRTAQCPCCGGIRIWAPAPRDHPHPDCLGYCRYVTTYVSEADDAHGVAVEFATDRGGPVARLYCGVCGWNLAHHCDGKPDGQLPGSSTKAAACLPHNNAALFRRCEVDVISVIPCLCNDFQIGQLLE